MISMENPENLKCNNCKKEWKPDDTDINKNGEVYKTCKYCREETKEYYKNNKEKIAENPKCDRCKKEWKPDDTDIKKSGKVYKSCKDCREQKKEYRKNNKEQMAEYNKKYRENNKEKIAEYYKERYENNKEQIAEYNKNYSKNNKEKRAEYNKERYENNKEKEREKAKEYSKNNKEKRAEYNKEYDKKNKEKKAERGKEYRKNNKEKIAERLKEYCEISKCEHNKIRGVCKICNLNRYLVNLNRTNIKRVLKSSSQNKTKSSIKYLGCDVEYFRDYFKKKMDLWNENKEIKMNWGNIHIDHIKPISVFNLDEEDELNKCCNYTNFQPLLATDNLRKNNKWTDEDEVYWNENIKGKEHFGIYMPV